MKTDYPFESDDFTEECCANILRPTAGWLLADELNWDMIKVVEPEAAYGNLQTLKFFSLPRVRDWDLVPAVAVNFEMGLTVQWLDRQIAREKMKEMRH